MSGKVSTMRKRGFGSVYQQKKRGADGQMAMLPTWWIKYSKAGRVYRESSGSYDQREAEKLLKRRLGEVVTGKFAGLEPERIRIRELTAEVLSDYENNDRSSRGHVERRLNLHILPVLGDIRAADFGTSDLKRYIAMRRREKASNASINRELAILKRGFHLGAENDPPRVCRIPHFPMLEENNVRKGFLEQEAYQKLRDALSPGVQLLFIVAYHVGCRRGELLKVRWSHVDLNAKRIRLEPGTTKNKEGRNLPIYGEMLERLRIEKEVRDSRFPTCQHVFRRGGAPIKNFRKSWESACVAVGLDGLMFHDLRRTAVRNMVRAGIPEKTAMAISGHKTRSVFDRYNIVNDRDLTDAAVRMEQHLKSLGILSGIPEKQEQVENAGQKPTRLLQ
jgi:integrase